MEAEGEEMEAEGEEMEAEEEEIEAEIGGREISAKLDATRCHCGLNFANVVALDNHVRGVHGLIVIYSCLKCQYESYSRAQTRLINKKNFNFHFKIFI